MGTDKGGLGGVVVNTGSNISVNPYVSVPIYSATKAAIVSLTRAFGVRVNMQSLIEKWYIDEKYHYNYFNY